MFQSQSFKQKYFDTILYIVCFLYCVLCVLADVFIVIVVCIGKNPDVVTVHPRAMFIPREGWTFLSAGDCL